MISQAYKLTYKNDPKLPWVMLITFVVVAGVVELVGILLGSPFLFLPIAVLLGLLATLIVFGRRAQGTAYRQVEGQPGAASGCSRACAATGGSPPASPATVSSTPSTGCSAARASCWSVRAPRTGCAA